MRLRLCAACAWVLLAGAQIIPEGEKPEPALPGGKNQKDEIVKADYRKSLEDSRELVRLAEELRSELEKNDRYVVSVGAIKKTEDIEKLAKRIRGRMKRY